MCARTYKTLQMLSEILGDTYINPLTPTSNHQTHKVRVVRTSRQALAQGGGTGRNVREEGDVLTSAYTIAQCGILLDIERTLSDIDTLVGETLTLDSI